MPGADETGYGGCKEGLVHVPGAADLEDIAGACFTANASIAGDGRWVGFADAGFEFLDHALGGAVSRGDHVAAVLVRLGTELGGDGVDELG